jgi:hypothetical protein
MVSQFLFWKNPESTQVHIRGEGGGAAPLSLHSYQTMAETGFSLRLITTTYLRDDKKGVMVLILEPRRQIHDDKRLFPLQAAS